MKELTPELRAKLWAALRRSSRGVVSTTLKAGDGQALAPADRAEMLRRAVAREDVRLVISVLAYEQERGKPNRNFVRFADAAMQGLGASGKGTIYLRDHNQWSSECVQGRVLESDVTELAPGHWQLHQTIEVTEPAAVERILRGLMRAVSIGWRSSGSLVCTACGETIDDDCCGYGHAHYPGEEVEIDGEIVVAEYEFQAAELVETSEVPIGGVPNAELEDIRAALSAANGNARNTTPRSNMSKLRETLAKHFKLAASATEDEVITTFDAHAAAMAKLKEDIAARDAELAAEKKKTEAKDDELEAKDAKLSIVEQDRNQLAIELKAFRATAAQADEDKAIGDARAAGKLSLAEEPLFRRLYKADKAGCLAELAGRAANSATPVGAPRQSNSPAPVVTAPEQLAAGVGEVLKQAGVDPALTLSMAKAFGAKDPNKAVANALGIKQEG